MKTIKLSTKALETLNRNMEHHPQLDLYPRRVDWRVQAHRQ